MDWNWQKTDWPDFSWDASRLYKAEEQFLLETGVVAGAVKHLGSADQDQLKVETISSEAVTTSEIEGETLDRASCAIFNPQTVRLDTDTRRIRPAEQGIAEMMVDLYRSPGASLTDSILFTWHQMMLKGRKDLFDRPVSQRRRAHASCLRSGARSESALRSAALFKGARGNDAFHQLVQYNRAGQRGAYTSLDESGSCTSVF
jgi:Fic family protein